MVKGRKSYHEGPWIRSVEPGEAPSRVNTQQPLRRLELFAVG